MQLGSCCWPDCTIRCSSSSVSRNHMSGEEMCETCTLVAIAAPLIVLVTWKWLGIVQCWISLQCISEQLRPFSQISYHKAWDANYLGQCTLRCCPSSWWSNWLCQAMISWCSRGSLYWFGGLWHAFTFDWSAFNDIEMCFLASIRWTLARPELSFLIQTMFRTHKIMALSIECLISGRCHFTQVGESTAPCYTLVLCKASVHLKICSLMM